MSHSAKNLLAGGGWKVKIRATRIRKVDLCAPFCFIRSYEALLSCFALNPAAILQGRCIYIFDWNTAAVANL